MRSALLIVFLTLQSPAAWAQMPNSALLSPDTKFEEPGVPAPNQTNVTDRLFAQLVKEGGAAEVALGRVAEKAETKKVREFAQRMIKDHSETDRTLDEIAEKSRIPLPNTLNPDHAAMRDRLEKLQGTSFDITYMRGQVVDHQKTAQLLIWEIGFGQDAELQRLAAKTLPVVLEHLSLAKEIVGGLSQEVAEDASSSR